MRTHRRPDCIGGELVMRPNVARYSSILLDAKQFPTPVRIVGAIIHRRVCRRDGGTTLNLSSLNKIIESARRSQSSGVRVGTLRRARRARQELPLTPNGHMTVGRGVTRCRRPLMKPAPRSFPRS